MFQKIFQTIKYIILNTIAHLVGYIIKPPKELWLFSERGFDARDNGYGMFRYVTKHYPEINAVYVITDDSPDKQKVQKLGTTIRYRSFRHYIYMMHARVLISSHDCGYTPNMVIYHHLAKHRLFHPKGKVVFLQHGVSDKIISWYFRTECKPDLFIVTANEEYENIRKNHHQPESVLQITGFPRFDNLTDVSKKKEKMILVMPTWRQYLTGMTNEEFKNSEYYNEFMNLLSHPKLKRTLEEQGYQLVFYPHIEMQKFLLPQENGLIRIASMDTDDIQNLLLTCELLITDYSSVYFDVAYMQKPIIFLQFDKSAFEGGHYDKCVIDYQRFGLICTTGLQTADELTYYLNSSDKDTYNKNYDQSFFQYYDKQNSKRVFDAIQRILDQEIDNYSLCPVNSIGNSQHL